MKISHLFFLMICLLSCRNETNGSVKEYANTVVAEKEAKKENFQNAAVATDCNSTSSNTCNQNRGNYPSKQYMTIEEGDKFSDPPSGTTIESNDDYESKDLIKLLSQSKAVSITRIAKMVHTNECGCNIPKNSRKAYYVWVALDNNNNKPLDKKTHLLARPCPDFCYSGS